MRKGKINNLKIIKTLWPHIKDEKVLFFSACLLAVLASVTEAMSFGLLIPIIESSKTSGSFSNVPLIGIFSDLFSGMEAQEKVMAAALALLIMTLLRGAIVWAGEVTSYSLPPRVDSKVKLRVFKALSFMPVPKIETISAGDFSVATAEGPARVGISIRFLQMLISNIIIVFINTIFLLIISPVATLTLIGSLLLLMFFYRLFTVPRLSKSGEDFTAASTQFNQIFYEIINNQVSSRLSGSRDSLIGKISNSISGVRDANLKKLLVEASVFPFFSTAIGISFCLLLAAVAFLGKTADAELIAKVVAIIYLMSRLLGPITVINVARVNLLANWHVVDRVVDLLYFAEKNKINDGCKEFSKLNNGVVFENVYFAYEGDSGGEDHNIINGLSFSICKGKKIGLVGRSGSGKSTVIKLLTRMYEPDSGSVLVDGICLKEYAIESYWSKIAVVLQGQSFSRGTVRENLLDGLDDLPSDEEIHHVLNICSLNEKVISLPNGLDELLGENGAGLSGGESQRLVLAKALLRKPEILIMDESTSGLDLETESRLLSNLDRFYPDIAMLIITHKSSTLEICDEVFLLSEGVISGVFRSSESIESNFKELDDFVRSVK